MQAESVRLFCSTFLAMFCNLTDQYFDIVVHQIDVCLHAFQNKVISVDDGERENDLSPTLLIAHLI